MSKLFVAAVAVLLCVLAATEARNVREAPAAASGTVATLPTTFADFVKQTDDAFKTVQANFLTFMGVKDTAELQTVLQTQTKSIADKLQSTVAQITEEAKTSQASELLKSYTDKLTAQIDSWKKENPDAVLTAEKYKENFEKGLKSVAAETQTFSAQLANQGEGINDNLQKLLKAVYDNTLDATKTVATQIEAAANKQ